MRAVLILLPLFAPIDLEIPSGTTLAQFLALGADRLDLVVLYDPALPLSTTKMGVCFKHRVKWNRLEDTYRAILAFFEIDLVDVGSNVRLAVRSRGPGFYKPNPHPIRIDFAVLGLGTRLEVDVSCDGLTMPPRTRNRLLLALRYGLHPQGRAMAARLLGAIGPHFKQTADALVRALDDGDEGVRLEAVKALGEMGAAAHHVRPRLRALLKNPRLRRASDRALQLTRTLDD